MFAVRSNGWYYSEIPAWEQTVEYAKKYNDKSEALKFAETIGSRAVVVAIRETSGIWEEVVH